MKKILAFALPLAMSVILFSCKEKDPVEPIPNPHNLRGSIFSNVDANTGEILQYMFDNKDTMYSKIQTIGTQTNTIETGKYTLDYPSLRFTASSTRNYTGTFSGENNISIEGKEYQRVP